MQYYAETCVALPAEEHVPALKRTLQSEWLCGDIGVRGCAGQVHDSDKGKNRSLTDMMQSGCEGISRRFSDKVERERAFLNIPKSGEDIVPDYRTPVLINFTRHGGVGSRKRNFFAVSKRGTDG